jgi:hypothetical protein
LKLDEREQVAPIVVSAVAVHGTAIRNGLTSIVPGWSWAGPFSRSVISTNCPTFSSPG